MTVDASRSCLGLETCVGSAIRQIVDARVLLTATVPPALPGSRMLGGSLAPPLAAIIGLVQSVCRQRHLPGDGPHEARTCPFQAMSRISLGWLSCRNSNSRLSRAGKR